MIINNFKIGNTEIFVDNTFLPKSEEEKLARYEEFNRIACDILYKEVKE